MQLAGLNKVIDIPPGTIQNFCRFCRVDDPLSGKGSEIIRRQEYAPRMLS
jgi:hypothetical protein